MNSLTLLELLRRRSALPVEEAWRLLDELPALLDDAERQGDLPSARLLKAVEVVFCRRHEGRLLGSVHQRVARVSPGFDRGCDAARDDGKSRCVERRARGAEVWRFARCHRRRQECRRSLRAPWRDRFCGTGGAAVRAGCGVAVHARRFRSRPGRPADVAATGAEQSRGIPPSLRLLLDREWRALRESRADQPTVTRAR